MNVNIEEEEGEQDSDDNEEPLVEEEVSTRETSYLLKKFEDLQERTSEIKETLLPEIKRKL